MVCKFSITNFYLIEVASCEVCQRVNGKLAHVRPQLHPVPVKSPWYHIGIDFIGPISPRFKSGTSYILNVSDYFSKWTEAFVTPDKSAAQTSACLFKV
jgi:hypothetical protein